MNRQPLKRYAPAARQQFRRAITEKAALLGLSQNHNLPVEIKGDFAIVGTRAFPREFAAQREKLERWIARDGFAAVIDEVAYTWFNRLMAIRFMEVNGYLGHGFLVLGRTNDRPEPEILLEAENVSLPGVDAHKVTQLKIAGDRDEELYRMLLLGQCHALHQAMPFLFEPISDESELLLPDALLPADSIVGKLVAEVPTELWSEIEIIGWLYQFYISERKDEVIGKVVATPDIPAATQLFTPNWIVKYMTQNSLGRLWLEANPDSPLRAQMDYYIEPAANRALLGDESQENVGRAANAATPLELETLRLLDPACGSGHILVEAYDLFKAMYLERGYRVRDAARSILQHNLWGLDIDPRAAQMAGFSLLMKARADDRRLLDDAPALHIHALRDGSDLDAAQLAQTLLPDSNLLERSPLETDIAALTAATAGAQTFGSLLKVHDSDANRLARLQSALDVAASHATLLGSAARDELQPLLDQTQMLAQKYDCVVANPPYMGSKYQTPALKAFLKKHFDGYEKDLFSAFIVRCLDLTKAGGHLGFMSPFVWMFISSYEELRRKLIDDATISTLVQLEYSGFDGATVPICTFTLHNAVDENSVSSFIKLSDFRGAENQAPKTLEAIRNPDCGWFYEAATKDFEKIPSSPIAYWVSEHIRFIFANFKTLADLGQPRQGMASTNNELFVRYWPEVALEKSNFYATSEENAQISGKKWFPYDKGGDYRKWYGNNESLVNYHNNGEEVCRYIDSSSTSKVGSNGRIINRDKYFKEGITWSAISSGQLSVRYTYPGHIFSNGGSKSFGESHKDLMIDLAFLNSSVAAMLASCISQTLNFNQGVIAKLPLLRVEATLECSEECVAITKADWDSFETSWDFGRSPLLSASQSLEIGFAEWEAATSGRRTRLRALEMENNRLFIAAYGLQDELSPDVPDEQITLARADREGDLKRLVSYALGCLLGRYSLDESGLVYAGSGAVGFDASRYETFAADADGIVPLTDIAWFAEDGATQLQRWLRAAYGEANYEANLTFWAQSLGAKSGETPDETLRRYLLNDFYKDHLRAYRNRPIYWQFSSGREKAFTALVYLHRMNAGTLSRLRTSYVLPLLSRYQARIEQLSSDVAASSGAAARAAEKERTKRAKQWEELRRYDELLRHRADEKWEFDLDDGVKVNYARFSELLGESKAVTGA